MVEVVEKKLRVGSQHLEIRERRRVENGYRKRDCMGVIIDAKSRGNRRDRGVQSEGLKVEGMEGVVEKRKMNYYSVL